MGESDTSETRFGDGTTSGTPGASSASTDEELPDGVVSDASKRRGLPPGAGTSADDDDIPGATREASPYEDAPAEGHLGPESD